MWHYTLQASPPVGPSGVYRHVCAMTLFPHKPSSLYRNFELYLPMPRPSGRQRQSSHNTRQSSRVAACALTHLSQLSMKFLPWQVGKWWSTSSGGPFHHQRKNNRLVAFRAWKRQSKALAPSALASLLRIGLLSWSSQIRPSLWRAYVVSIRWQPQSVDFGDIPV